MSDSQYKDVHTTLPTPFPKVVSHRSWLFFICLAMFGGPVDAGGRNMAFNSEGNAQKLNSEQGTTAYECGTNKQARREQQTAQLPGIAGKAAKPIAFNCLSAVSRIHDLWSKEKSLLIDVRRPDEFRKYQIPGSLNLAPFSIKTKHFLRDKQLVLLNEGRQHRQLDELCNRLKKDGFHDVVVMEGGIYAWQRQGLPVVGVPFEISKLNQLSSADFFSSLPERDWKYIDLDRSSSSLTDLIPSSAVIDYPSNKGSFISAVNQAQGEFDQQALSGFVVISSKGEGYDTVERLLRLTDAKNVYYLSGGAHDLKFYLNNLASQLSRLASGFEEPHRCGG